MHALPWAWCAAALLLADAAHYDFDNALYNQQLLDQVDDALRPWRQQQQGSGHERPRFRHKGGVLVARWYPSRRGEPAQYQWSWEVPPGVNQSAKMWWRRYYPNDYYRRRYCRYGYCRRYSGYGYGGYGYRRRGYGGGYGGYGRFGGYGGGYGGSGRFGGSGRIGTGSSFDRIVLPDEDEPQPLTNAPASSVATAAVPPTTAAPGTSAGGDPNADAEEINVKKDIAKLPEATVQQLEGVDGQPGHIPFQEQVCCGRDEEVGLMRQDAVRAQCFMQEFNSTVHSEEGQNWNHFSCTAVDEIKEKIKCIHQCIWKIRGTFENDGDQISVSKLRAFYHDSESQPWRARLLDEAAVKCMAEFQSECGTRISAGRLQIGKASSRK